MNKLHLSLLFTSFFLLIACEYDPGGNNFVELTPPEDSILIDITLNNIDPSDTIFLYQNTLISIKLTSEKEVRTASVLLDEQLLSNTLSFIINPLQISEGLHKLKVNAVLATGTGSLAEMMGLEGYIGELSWNVRVIHKPLDHLKIGYRINDEGFMEIYWESPFPESLIQKYDVHAGIPQKKDTTIYAAAHNYFIDYGYVCESGYYEIRTYLKDGFTFFQNLSFSTPTPKLYLEASGIDNLRLYWDRPIANGRFYITDYNDTIASGIHDTTITIPQVFGEKHYFLLNTRPLRKEFDGIRKYLSSVEFYMGVSLGLVGEQLYAYNRKDNIIYARKYDDLIAINASTLQQINKIRIKGNPWGFSYGGKVASATHNSTVAAMTGEETLIFSDSRFINPTIISSLPGNIHTHLAALTSDDRFFVVSSGSYGCKVYNSLTGEKLFVIPFTYRTIYDWPDFITVSDDGRYFCSPSDMGIEVFVINGDTANLIYTDTRIYKGAMFVPSEPDKLLLRVDSDIEMRQMPDFDLIQKLDVSDKGGLLCNIDPTSMNLLYYQDDSLRVSKVSNIGETIFKLRSDERDCSMFNNKILTRGSGGLAFDINPYLNH